MSDRSWNDGVDAGGTSVRTQATRFLVVGVASVAIDYAVYSLLCEAGISSHVCKGLSYVAGMGLGFYGNKYWTFGSRRRAMSEPLAYCGVYAVSFMVNVCVNAAVLASLGGSGRLAAFLCATGITTVLNFLGMKYLAFRHGGAVASG